MTEILMPLVSGLMICLTVAILFYWTIKSNKLEEILTNSVENVLHDVSNDAELQKNIYIIGGMIGNGAKSGLGISGKGGKFKIEDLLMQLVGKYLGGVQTENNISDQKLP